MLNRLLIGWQYRLKSSLVKIWRYFMLLIAVSLICGASLVVQVLSVWVDYKIYESQYQNQWQSQLFYNAIHNPADALIAVHFKLWSHGIEPDLATRFYRNTPFARWVNLIQGSSLVLAIGSLIFAILSIIDHRQGLETENQALNSRSVRNWSRVK